MSIAKDTIKHSSIYTVLTLVLAFFGSEPIKAIAQEMVTKEVTERVDKLEDTIKDTEAKVSEVDAKLAIVIQMLTRAEQPSEAR